VVLEKDLKVFWYDAPFLSGSSSCFLVYPLTLSAFCSSPTVQSQSLVLSYDLITSDHCNKVYGVIRVWRPGSSM